MKVRSQAAYTAFMGAKQRLREASSWFPIPALLSFFLVMLLTTHIAVSTNPRVGQPAATLPLAAEPSEDSAIWISVVVSEDDVIVSDNSRNVFRWPKELKSLEQIAPFVAHLKERKASEIKAATLANRISSYQTKALIAVDQNLKYSHFRPILYALAEAGISDYGFETNSLQTEAVAEAQSQGATEEL